MGRPKECGCSVATHQVVEALHLLSAPGDAVVVTSPVYPPFYSFLETIGRRVLEAPLAAGRLDLDALAEAFRQRPAAFLLCSPHNPTGTVHTAEELTAVAALAREHGVRVVVDEIHAPLVLPGAHAVDAPALRERAPAFWCGAAGVSWSAGACAEEAVALSIKRKTAAVAVAVSREA